VQYLFNESAVSVPLVFFADLIERSFKRLTIDMVESLNDRQCPVFRLGANVLCEWEPFTTASVEDLSSSRLTSYSPGGMTAIVISSPARYS
jgi:hypothetical protein